MLLRAAALFALALHCSAFDTIALFDGRSLNGWQARPTFDPGATGDWNVTAGSLRCPGVTPGWLSTDATFRNFVLTVEFRGAAGVNSGIFLRSQKQGQPHVTGYELQIWDHQPAGYLTGSLVGVAKAKPASLRGGQWNRFVITADGPRIRAALNGVSVLDVEDSQHREGVIGLQCQKDNPIEFRKIELKRLP